MVYTGLSSPSVLLSHECAYVLGQMQDSYASPALIATLENKKIDPVVRHEVSVLYHAYLKVI